MIRFYEASDKINMEGGISTGCQFYGIRMQIGISAVLFDLLLSSLFREASSERYYPGAGLLTYFLSMSGLPDSKGVHTISLRHTIASGLW